MRLSGKTALITGASSGIGLELAKLFAQDGCNLVLVARQEEKLRILGHEWESQYGVGVTEVALDLTLASAPDDLAVRLLRERIQVDIVVSNAGFGVYGSFAKTDLKFELDMIQVNITALTHLTKLFLPGMISRGYGKILNVPSTAAFQPGPLMAVYYASKAYVLSFSEALSSELRKTGVTVTTLCPGPTATEFQSRAGVGHLPVMRAGLMEAAVVAKAGYESLLAGRRVVIPGLSNRMIATAVRWIPRRWVLSAVRRLQERRSRTA